MTEHDIYIVLVLGRFYQVLNHFFSLLFPYFLPQRGENGVDDFFFTNTIKTLLNNQILSILIVSMTAAPKFTILITYQIDKVQLMTTPYSKLNIILNKMKPDKLLLNGLYK